MKKIFKHLSQVSDRAEELILKSLTVNSGCDKSGNSEHVQPRDVTSTCVLCIAYLQDARVLHFWV